MLQIHREVDLREPVLVCAFTGWSDAASAASGALSYVLEKWASHELASFDAEAIYNYTVTRPVVRLSGEGLRALQWPTLTCTGLPLPHAPQDLLLLVGPEPDLRWQACSREVIGLARRFGATRIIGLGCFYAPVAHSAPVPLVGTAVDPDLRAALRALAIGETRYQGPTGFLSAVLDAARRASLPAATIWGAAPSYLQGMPNPKVSAALLETVQRLLHADLGSEELAAMGRELQARIDEALAQRPDLRQFVEKLQANVTEAEAEPAAEPPEELPSAEAVLRDLEQYLRQLQEPDEE
ncbi:MAG: PAC2 family protein [Chloroflexi bacterium]|nr:PAC2 family protein [Chloroflexota bacterium]